MNLRELWKKYDSYNQFNVSVLSEEIKTQGVQLVYPAGSVIISLGDFPDYVYFIQSGSAIGTRDYHDGNNYFYFRITSENGSVGLLEVLARKDRSVATVVAETQVTALRISSSIIYEYLMKNVGCTGVPILWPMICISVPAMMESSIIKKELTGCGIIWCSTIPDMPHQDSL